jgi:hypothetical protein
MGPVFYLIGTAWCIAILTLIVLKRRFWPPVYQLGIPVLRQQSGPLGAVPPVGSVVRTVHGTGKVIAPGRLVFLGSRFFRTPVALIATIDVGACETSVVARIPADAVCGAALCVAVSLSFAAAILIQGGGAAVSSLAAALGVGLVLLWWIAYRLAYLGSRKKDVIGFLGELEADRSVAQA